MDLGLPATLQISHYEISMLPQHNKTVLEMEDDSGFD